MRGKLLLALLLFSLFAFSGCVKMEFWEEISAEGISSIRIVVEPSEKFGDVDIGQLWTKNPCEELESNPNSVDVVDCKFDGKKVELSGTFDRNASTGLVVEGKKYRFDLGKALRNTAAPSAMGGPQELYASGQGSEQQLEMLKSMGFSFDYYIKMPGRVVAREGGEMQPDGWVKFDLMETNVEGAFVESSTEGFSLGDGLQGITVLVGFAVALWLLSHLAALKR